MQIEDNISHWNIFKGHGVWNKSNTELVRFRNTFSGKSVVIIHNVWYIANPYLPVSIFDYSHMIPEIIIYKHENI